MPEIGALVRVKPRDTTVDLGDGDLLTVTFDMNKVSPAWTEAAERRDDAQDALSLPKALAEVILDWDVTQDGQPFAASVENIAVLPYPAQSAVLKAIITNSMPSDAEGEDSAARSSTASTDSAAPQQTPPDGQTTSQSPALSASPSPT
jgi:hypothetical protein